MMSIGSQLAMFNTALMQAAQQLNVVEAAAGLAGDLAQLEQAAAQSMESLVSGVNTGGGAALDVYG